jgi:hypothetical protein
VVRWSLGLAVCIALGWFYVAAGTEHGRRVNLSKARGDQTGYLWDAKNIFDNWRGRQPPMIIGERNRMPVYSGFLALFYRPAWSDPEFFEVGKRLNVYLSLGLIALLGLILARELPPLAAVNLTLIVMFGYFIFKAGYTQSELLFYFFLFLTFLGCWHLFRTPSGGRALLLAAATGAAAGVAHLTKAAMPPFILLFLVMFAAQPLVGLVEGQWGAGQASIRAALWRWAAALAFAVACLAVLSPYLATNKRVFGRYIYNVNTNFYVWYDDWASASVGVRLHGDDRGWPTLPKNQMPSARRYWREHTVGQIAARIASGFKDMATVSFTTYNFLPYLLLHTAIVALLLVTRPALMRSMIQDHAYLTAFVVLYELAYMLATAFYFPVSGTGTARFFLAHLLPLLFVSSRVFSSARLANVEWRPAGVPVKLQHFQLMILVMLAVDVPVRVWPRLMTTYGGF